MQPVQQNDKMNQSPKEATPGHCAYSHLFCKTLTLTFWQLAEAEGELDEMTKNRDELQAVVDELEEKVQPSDLKRVPTLCPRYYTHGMNVHLCC